MAQPFKDIRIFYDGLGRTAVSWALDHRFSDPYPHTFELQFAKDASYFATGGYEVIDSGVKVNYLYDSVLRDTGLPSFTYYRVKLTTPAGAYLSDVKGLEGNVHANNIGILRELLRKESLTLRKDRGGVGGWLFKRRYYGPACTCTDKNTNTLVSTACLKCAGTGFRDGYFPGAAYPILISGQAQKLSGPNEVRLLQARCLAFPVASNNDIWMEEDTSRVYEVGGYDIVSRLSYQPVACTIDLKELPLVDTAALLISALKQSLLPQAYTDSKSYLASATKVDAAKRITSEAPSTYLVGRAGSMDSIDNPFAPPSA